MQDFYFTHARGGGNHLGTFCAHVTIDTAVIQQPFTGTFSLSSCLVSTGYKQQRPRNSYTKVTYRNSILFPQGTMRISRIMSATKSWGTIPCSHLVEKCLAMTTALTPCNAHEDVTVRAEGCRPKWWRPSPVGQCLFRQGSPLCLFSMTDKQVFWGLCGTIGDILDTIVCALQVFFTEFCKVKKIGTQNWVIWLWAEP